MNTDVENLLREGMERFTADLHAPSGIIHRAVLRRRRRLALRSAVAATALAAGVAALVVTLLPAVRGAAPGSAANAAYVVKQVSSALNAAKPGEIAQMTISTTSAPIRPGKKATSSITTTTKEWSYGDQWRAVAYSPAGRQVYDEGTSSAGVYTLVNYLKKTWARQSGLGRPAKLPSPARPGKRDCAPAFAVVPVLFRFGLPGLGSYASSTPATVATALRTAVSCGTLDIAGHQQVNGINAIKLTSRPGSLISETIWVSPGTYLPVRVVVGRAGPGARPGIRQTANITWLPPTAKNLAKLTVPVPAGFGKVTFPQAGTPILHILPARLLPRASCRPSSPAGRACHALIPVPHNPATPVPGPKGV